MSKKKKHDAFEEEKTPRESAALSSMTTVEKAPVVDIGHADAVVVSKDPNHEPPAENIETAKQWATGAGLKHHDAAGFLRWAQKHEIQSAVPSQWAKLFETYRKTPVR